VSSLVTTILAGAVGSAVMLAIRRVGLARSERHIRATRARLSAPVEYGPPRDADASLVDKLDRRSDDEARELARCGFAPVGDIVARGDLDVQSAMRVFVDELETIIAYVVVVPDTTWWRALLFESYTPDEKLSTYATVSEIAPPAPLAAPPFVDRHVAPFGESIASVIAAHRVRVTELPCIRVTSRDDAIRELQRVYEMNRRWRNAQPERDLLDLDLRAMLGRKYARSGKAWLKRLAPRVPTAVARPSAK
jgi:hypothetical protein